MNVQTGREVRLGLIALALSGLLWTVGIVLRGPADLADPGSCCRAEFSPAMYVASTVIAVGAMLPLYGFFGLYRYLSYRHTTIESPSWLLLSASLQLLSSSH